LVIRKSFDLYSEALPFITSARKVIPIHEVAWPGNPLGERMPLEVRLVGVDAPPVLFLLELQFGKLTKISDLPANITAIHWSPDGSGGLVVLSDASLGSQFLFITLDGSGMYDLQPSLGPDPRDFYWLPAVVRTG
jgi:hypothetical protein